MAKLNYHHLQYFHAIVKHGSIATAAKALHITPQTLSSQLHLLEEQLGGELFDRVGKRLLLNDVGRVTYNYAKEIFDLGDELLQSLATNSTGSSSKFHIGVTDVVAKVLFYNFLKAIYTMDEPVKVICKETSLEVLVGELATNKLDAIFSDTPLPTGSALKAYSHMVGKSGLSFFAHKSLADELSKEFPQSLHLQPFFMAGEGTNQRLSVLSWFDQLGISPDIIGEFDDSALAKYFGQAGFGVFCGPTLIEKNILDQFDVALVGRTTDITENYYLISPERKIKHPAVQYLLEQGKTHFEQPVL
ncbi:MAG: transcriptional activator NhaR [Gammaproteobacteria bacterium]|nr:transcriptional activator NhaR [Gammaproteobacteria bacterium]